MIAATFRADLLAGKIAPVAGGTGGIGAAIADALALCGAVVTVTGATTDEASFITGALVPVDGGYLVT